MVGYPMHYLLPDNKVTGDDIDDPTLSPAEKARKALQKYYLGADENYPISLKEVYDSDIQGRQDWLVERTINTALHIAAEGLIQAVITKSPEEIYTEFKNRKLLSPSVSRESFAATVESFHKVILSSGNAPRLERTDNPALYARNLVAYFYARKMLKTARELVEDENAVRQYHEALISFKTAFNEYNSKLNVLKRKLEWVRPGLSIIVKEYEHELREWRDGLADYPETKEYKKAMATQLKNALENGTGDKLQALIKKFDKTHFFWPEPPHLREVPGHPYVKAYSKLFRKNDGLFKKLLDIRETSHKNLERAREKAETKKGSGKNDARESIGDDNRITLLPTDPALTGLFTERFFYNIFLENNQYVLYPEPGLFYCAPGPKMTHSGFFDEKLTGVLRGGFPFEIKCIDALQRSADLRSHKAYEIIRIIRPDDKTLLKDPVKIRRFLEGYEREVSPANGLYHEISRKYADLWKEVKGLDTLKNKCIEYENTTRLLKTLEKNGKTPQRAGEQKEIAKKRDAYLAEILLPENSGYVVECCLNNLRLIAMVIHRDAVLESSPAWREVYLRTKDEYNKKVIENYEAGEEKRRKELAAKLPPDEKENLKTRKPLPTDPDTIPGIIPVAIWGPVHAQDNGQKNTLLKNGNPVQNFRAHR